MKKRLNLATRAFGAEPAMPDIAALAAWIEENRGTAADIITYLLDQSLAPQVAAGISAPCAGGRFYKNRVMECLFGVEGGKATDEVYLNYQAILEDAAKIVVQKTVPGVPCPLPIFSGSLIRSIMMNLSGTMQSPVHTGP